MFRLWSLAEQDLLSPDFTYRLRDTGQGLNRVQAAPKTSHMMHAILNRAQKSIGSWVGSSVIHMGDHNVPNALMFIGKRSVLIHENSLLILFHQPQTNTPKSTAYSSRSAQPSPKSPHSCQNLPYTPTSTTNSGPSRTSIVTFLSISSDTPLMAQAQTISSTRVRALTDG